MVRVVILKEEYKYHATPEEQKTLDELINNILKPIELDCMTFNASVDVIVTKDGNYKPKANCDQYSTLLAMQSLLPEIIPSFQ